MNKFLKRTIIINWIVTTDLIDNLFFTADKINVCLVWARALRLLEEALNHGK